MYNRRYTPRFINLHKDEKEIFVIAEAYSGISEGVRRRRSSEAIVNLQTPEFGKIACQRYYFMPLKKEGVSALKPYVDEFIEYAIQHSDYTFIVCWLGNGFVGFEQKEVALLFKKAIDVENIILPKLYVEELRKS